MSGLPGIDSASLSDSRFLRPATCMGRHNSSAVATPARNPPWPPSHTEAPLFVCGAGGLKASCDVRSAWPEQEANERISSTPQPCKPRLPLTSSCSLGGGGQQASALRRALGCRLGRARATVTESTGRRHGEGRQACSPAPPRWHSIDHAGPHDLPHLGMDRRRSHPRPNKLLGRRNTCPTARQLDQTPWLPTVLLRRRLQPPSGCAPHAVAGGRIWL